MTLFLTVSNTTSNFGLLLLSLLPKSNGNNPENSTGLRPDGTGERTREHIYI